jgi:hypothetical protein
MSTASRYIAIIQKVEASYSDWTTSRLIDNLRHIGSFDNSLFQQLLGTQPGINIQPKGNLIRSDIDELALSMSHSTKGGQEAGISLDDSTGRQVALGHVIVGISAGIHHPLPVIYVDIGAVSFPLLDVNIKKERLGLDPLYATTITGDLGQTVTPPNTLCTEVSCSFGGVGSEATSAELHGDIDGFMLGYWLCTTINGQAMRESMVQGSSVKLSTILGEYYRTRTDRPLGMTAGTSLPLEAIRRFSNFKATFKALKNTFSVQTVAFNSYYAPYGKNLPNPFKSLQALYNFEQWCGRGGV